MNKTLTIIGGAIAGLAILGAGGYVLADSWLDSKAETEVENQLLEATGGMAAVGSADVQLLRQRVAFTDIQLNGIEGIASENLLNIQQLVLDKPRFQGKKVNVDAATVEGITINIDGDTSQIQAALASFSHANVDFEQMSKDLSGNASSTTQANGSSAANGFTIDELNIEAIAINLDLAVPWQQQRLQHTITIPATTITNVTDENIAEKVILALGEPAFRNLQTLFLQQILPSSLEELQQSLPTEIDLSNIQLPEGMELPETIELPSIKLPESKN
ncbi:hypothetical protein [[Limnothrix rosea] IAM M-220]|uniref:hypothetical protein n=1 Tax=[Limnothrix rosea] IAM M-220 TaxID=454133 RepID=UPI00095CFB31|nr:hypothetical protein [[Limnothrix rosea] IAM M-220]OKH18588.1 hypothetical protein NIES208_05100 [[Limnothrix rosea] IAM M-220]